jgi:hypothetical protein
MLYALCSFHIHSIIAYSFPQLVMHYTSLLPLNYHSTLHTLVCHYRHFTLYVFTILYIVHFSTYCHYFYFSFASSTSTRHLLSNLILIAFLSFIYMSFILIPIPNTTLLSFYCYTLWLQLSPCLSPSSDRSIYLLDGLCLLLVPFFCFL